jgi:hypothetical protein
MTYMTRTAAPSELMLPQTRSTSVPAHLRRAHPVPKLPALSVEEVVAAAAYRRRRLAELTQPKTGTRSQRRSGAPEPANQLSWELRYHSEAARLRQRRIVAIARRARWPAPAIGGPEAAERQANIRPALSWAQRGPH